MQSCDTWPICFGPVVAHERGVREFSTTLLVEQGWCQFISLCPPSHSTFGLTLLYEARTKVQAGCYVYVCPPLGRAGRCGFGGRGVTPAQEELHRVSPHTTRSCILVCWL